MGEEFVLDFIPLLLIPPLYSPGFSNHSLPIPFMLRDTYVKFNPHRRRITAF
jgi:hypothetical protein